MVSLTKNQTVSLSKTAKSSLDVLQVGLGWDPVKKKKGFFGSLLGGGDEIDLDASCVLMTADGTDIDTIWFSQLKSRCGGVIHNGDNLTGEGDGDDEVITVTLSALPSVVEYLAFTVNSFRGQTFDEVENAFCRVVSNGREELVRYQLNEKGSHTGILVASLRRNGGDWEFKAHGKACAGQRVDQMMPEIKAEVLG